MKKFFIILVVSITATVMGGCLNLEGILPFLNKPPVIISEPIITATEDQLYSYKVEASDPNGDTLTYSFITKLEGMNIDSKNGLLTWIPTNNQVGIHQIIVETSDGKLSDTQSFKIEVFNVNDPPLIFSYFPSSLNVGVNEGGSIKFEIKAYDIDLSTTLSYQWLLNGKEVSNSTGSGNCSKSSWIYFASYGDYSQKIVKILVSDGQLEGQDYIQWNLTINDITPPTRPTLNTVSSPTNISPQILSGTKEADNSIWINGLEVVPINLSTTWSYSFNLSKGENNISVTSQDLAGNESGETTVKIILDTISPVAASLHKVITPTNISPQTLSGTKESNSSIWINGVEVVPLNSSVNWSYSYNLSEGTNNISIASWDAAGNESALITTTIIFDISAPAAPTLDTVVSPTNISSQILSGNKETNSSIWINGTEVISINSDTAWSYTFDLFEGNNHISITSRDASGNESLSASAVIVLDTDVPEAPILDTVLSPTNISPQTLSGTKETNTSVWINNIEIIPINLSINWIYDFNLSEGENNISTTSQDSAGNESGETTVKIILDSISPTIPTLNEVISPTNIFIQVLFGGKEANSSIWLNGTEIITVNSSMNWSYAYNLTEGTNNISIASWDAAGNESAPITTTIIFDISAPAAPTLDTVVSPTNISSQILSGNKETNSSIWINGTEVISINSDTAWSYTFDLFEGNNHISITSRDASGNESLSASAVIVLDTDVPEAPILDTVLSPTNISPQILSGTKEADNSIWINGLEVVPINLSTTWSYSFNLSKGENNISVTSQDLAGNESGETTVKIILDTISPVAASLHKVITPTNISPQTLSGTKESNSSIWINGVEVVPLNSSVNWSYSYNLSEGTNNISIASWDAAGNESALITTTIIFDISAPAAPTLDTVVSPTNISSQILSGNKETNSSIWINGTEVISINSDTAWSYTFDLFEGNNHISITSRDASGNESLSASAVIVLDTDVPEAPILDTVLSPTNISPQTLSGTKETNTSVWINNIEIIPINLSINWIYDFNLSEGENNISTTSQDSAGNESGETTVKIILDSISPTIPTLNEVISPTNIFIQVLFGGKEANSSIWLNGTEIITVNSSMNWSYAYNLTEGTNNISIASWDAAGNESAPITTTIIFDISAPAAPTLDTVVSPTNISSQILSGNKETNSSIWINGTEIISINFDTAWSYTFDLFEGNNHISITSRDASGNESLSASAVIVLDTIAPETPTLNTITSPTNISSQILSGTKDTNSSILINGAEIISDNSSVNWSYSYNLSEGTNNISITSRDAVGNESFAIITTIEYDPNIYVDAANTTGIEDGTQTHPFNTITEGLIAVAPGKSVIVTAAIYNEQLIINKEGITLYGADKENTFINGASVNGNLIILEADNITITGFTIDGDGSASVGIYFDNYSSINIYNNIIQNNSIYGINYNNSSPTIKDNEIKDNDYSGIDIGTGGAGIIRNNSIVSNQHGIRIYGDSCPEITRNNISNNIIGIYCRESATPIISYNTISNNTGNGILIDNILGNLVNPDIGGGDGQSDGQNKITGNSIHGVSNKTTHNIYAKYNWWGDTAGPKYPNNPDGNAALLSDWAYWSKTNGDIIFAPHLTTEP